MASVSQIANDLYSSEQNKHLYFHNPIPKNLFDAMEKQSNNIEIMYATINNDKVKILDRFTKNIINVIHPNHYAKSTCFSNNGKIIAVVNKKHYIRIYDVYSKKMISTINFERGSVESIYYSPNNKMIATISK